MAESLGDKFRIASANPVVPGRSNPKEVVIVVENLSATAGAVNIEGSWLSDAERGYGSVRSTLEIAAGDTAEFRTGTRSVAASRFLASIIPVEGGGLPREDAALLEAAASGAQGYGVAYTPTPTLAEIPAWSPRGLANGAIFHGKTIFFAPFETTGWRLEIHDREFDPMRGTAIPRTNYPDLQTIYIDLPSQPAAGKIFERPMAYGGGYFQIKATADSEQTTSWNSLVAWAIEITEWQAAPWREGGETFQRAGSASGRLYVCFHGPQGEIRDSFIAGEFTDAPILYFGPPRQRQ